MNELIDLVFGKNRFGWLILAASGVAAIFFTIFINYKSGPNSTIGTIAITLPFWVMFVYLMKKRSTSLKLFYITVIATTIALLTCYIAAYLQDYGSGNYDFLWISSWLLAGGLALIFLISTPNDSLALEKNLPQDDFIWFENADLSGKRLAITKQLSLEAKAMKKTSFVALAGVAFLIAIAVMVALFAGLITNIDLSGADKLSSARGYVAQHEEAYDRAKADRNSIRDAIDNISINQKLTEPQKKTKLNSLGIKFDEANDEVISVRIRKDRALKLLADTNEELLGLAAKEVDKDNNSSQALIASAVTRFGVIGVLLFFAQALINLYRYSLKLSAAHQTRAIAIGLASDDLKDLENIVKNLSLDSISLGKEPMTPFSQLEKLADVTSKLKLNS